MLEQIADVVVFVMRPEYYLKRNMTCYLDETYGAAEEGLNHPHGQGVAYVSVAKQRDGNVGISAMHFTERYTRFGDLEMQRTELN
jgi:replicative DNA helicase